MMTILIVDDHYGVYLGHVIDLILGDGVDLHLVEHLHEAAVGSLGCGLDDDDGFLQVLILAYLGSCLVISCLGLFAAVGCLKAAETAVGVYLTSRRL